MSGEEFAALLNPPRLPLATRYFPAALDRSTKEKVSLPSAAAGAAVAAALMLAAHLVGQRLEGELRVDI